MKKILLIITLFLIGSNISNAQSDRWVYLATERDQEFDVYYDIETIEYKTNSVLVWIKRNYNKSFIKEGKEVNFSLQLTEFNCISKKLKWDSAVFYYKNCSHENKNFTNSEYENIIPETIGELLWNYFCN